MCVYKYTGLSLVCYLENIRVKYVVNENIIPNQENDMVFSYEFEKIALQKNNNIINRGHNPPPPPPPPPGQTPPCLFLYTWTKSPPPPPP